MISVSREISERVISSDGLIRPIISCPFCTARVSISLLSPPYQTRVIFIIKVLMVIFVCLLFNNLFKYLYRVECCSFKKLISRDKKSAAMVTKYKTLTNPSHLHIILSFYGRGHRILFI